MINWIRAIIQVYSWEMRLFLLDKLNRHSYGCKFYIIENTTRFQRVLIYKNTWDDIGYIRGVELVRCIKANYDVTINMYKLSHSRIELIREILFEEEEEEGGNV